MTEHERLGAPEPATPGQDRGTPRDSVTFAEDATPGSSTPGVAAALGALIGRYVVLEKLGAGGMGVVYKAYDPELDRIIALKLLLPGGTGPSASQARLLREAQAMAKLSHPNVITVYDVGTAGDRVYIAMEFVEGRTLSAWASEATQTRREVMRVFTQAGAGLSAAHAKRLIHRDFKPDNVMVDSEGRVRVMDFGLARASRSDAGPREPADTNTGASPRVAALASDLTQAGAAIGTPAYMAPEQFLGVEADARADQFSFCVALWEALHGRRPFAGKSFTELAFAVTQGEITPPAQPKLVPAWLRDRIERGLRPRPDQRWPSMKALLDALAEDPTVRRRRLTVGAAAVVGLVAVLAGREIVEQRAIAVCEASAGELEQLWNSDSRARVGEALMHAAPDYGEPTFAKSAPILDRWAAKWADARRETCLAATVEHTRDARLHARSLECLDEGKAELETTLEALATGGADVTRHAVVAAASLPGVHRCVDADWLSRRPTPPTSDLASEGIAQVRRSLARAAAAERAGQFDEGLATARQALVAARELAWDPLTAAAQLTLGSLLESHGDFEGARAALIEAYLAAARMDETDIKVLAAVSLTGVVGSDLERREEGEVWANLAAVALDLQPSGGGLNRAHWSKHVASMLRTHGEYERAAAKHREAIASFERLLGPAHPHVAGAKTSLAVVLEDQGEYEEAEATHREAIAIWEDALGHEHPDVALANNNLAAVLRGRGDHGGAEATHREALAVQERVLRPDHPDIAQSKTNLAAVLQSQGRYQEAEGLVRAALASYEKSLDPGHSTIATVKNNLAMLLKDQRRFDEAQALLREAKAIWEGALGVDHPNVAAAKNNLAMVLASQGDYEAAEIEYRETLALLIRTTGPDHEHVGMTKDNLALVLEKRGQPRAAEIELHAAITILDKTLGPDHPAVAMALDHLGSLLYGQQDMARAQSVLQRALYIRSTSLVPPSLRGRTAWTLARVFVARGHRQRATDLAIVAKAAFEAAGNARRSTELEVWIAANGLGS